MVIYDVFQYIIFISTSNVTIYYDSGEGEAVCKFQTMAVPSSCNPGLVNVWFDLYRAIGLGDGVAFGHGVTFLPEKVD